MNPENFKGRGAQINPDNPWIRQHRAKLHPEGIDDWTETVPRTQVFPEESRSILSRNDSLDIPFTWSVNPYQGCEHGCAYCYARNSHEYWGFSAGLDWESKIMVKKNAARLLEEALMSRHWKPEPIMVSGNTDPYQPLERKYRVTREILEVMLRYRHPLSIITKSSLILRDLDILSALAKHSLVRVMFSITTLNEQLRRRLEPRTAAAEKLLSAISLLSREGVPAGVMVGPVIPSLNDHEMPEILRRAAQAGALGAGYSLARFNGAIAQIFHDWLIRHYPDRADKIWHKVASMHGGQVHDSRWGLRMLGEGQYASMIRELFTLSRMRYFKGRKMPDFDLTQFRRGGNLNFLSELSRQMPCDIIPGNGSGLNRPIG
jgi:DNA repair photolyase